MKQICISHSSENSLSTYFIKIPESLLYICGTYGDLTEGNNDDPDLPSKDAIIQIENILEVLGIEYDNFVDNLNIVEVPSECESYIP